MREAQARAQSIACIAAFGRAVHHIDAIFIHNFKASKFIFRTGWDVFLMILDLENFPTTSGSLRLRMAA